ncbi:cobyric acid synthase [Maritalea porphyrae]|uniref:Cobyric acid synthase n=1 Tax=Maritalea porphyrae TaxID=880732 RepID=A0ABQ5UQ78_9HYPH|nr:cobyric acid synthase [Maritalea porphyrae]GLQ17415.1 cobyric acid synthase [Maritalea porphyrae]
MAKSLMIMGTGSDVGKSLVTAGLCRAFTNRGFSVRPFKPQNMSNNAAVTADGGEIGRAQALQARACKTEPTTAMNPVLLKPEQETGAQVVVRGKRVASMTAREYFKKRSIYLPEAISAFEELQSEADLVFVEGAGSASEINLRSADIANFGFARALNLPVMLVGDIHRGGVIASIIGTLEVIDPKDRALIVGSLINRFHGDPSLFDEGRRYIEDRSGLLCWGPLPDYPDARLLPPEDVLALDHPQEMGKGEFKIAVPRLPRIANFDDLDPLRQEEGVSVHIIQPGNPLPLDADLIILPGSKSTISDFEFLVSQGWDVDIKAHVRQGKSVLGICGGYQMLGQSIADPKGIEGSPKSTNGLGLLDVKTELSEQKQLRLENAVSSGTDMPLAGYHMHMGETIGADRDRPFAMVGDNAEGAVSPNGRVIGTYLHGLFSSDEFRRHFLAQLGAANGAALEFERRIDQVLDGFANHLEHHVNLDQIAATMKEARKTS